ncbi:BREX system Lon protease-like protein BrxL [Schleiferiaceae bacterium]|nr:BREX system Lon protease-like protein BrxL [Schleiferiaceae bacterium]
MSLKEKIISNFEGKVVRKDLTALVKGNNPVPVYVLEYLLGQYCVIDDEKIISDGVDKVRNIIAANYVHRSDAEVVKHKIRSQGSYKIIDKINVSLNDRANIYQAEFANLGLKNVPIADVMVDENRKLLSGGGVWCVLTMAYSHADETDMRWVIADLKPIQVSNVDLDEYKSLRANFSTDEWIDVLMHSIGLLPETFSRRDKFIQLSRLIPHVENNFNFIELGPKGTGKSHIFSELSPHGVLVSGGDVSKARLFVNNTGNKIGLVGFWDVVALDEFEQEKGGKRTDGDLVKIMQNYMANQSFNRGKETYQATASMAFVGNTKHNVPYMLKNSHLFESIPEGYIKGAFLDRMHMYIPGWEVRILKSSVFSNEYGFIVDYLAELLRELRKADYSVHLDGKIKLDGSLTTRDKTAVRKSFSGLAKILYPHGVMTDGELLELLDFAIEGRKRVKDQLYIIDETFKSEPVEFKYTVISSGQEVSIETLENQNYKAAVEAKEEEDSEQEEKLDQGGSPTPKPELQSGQVILKDNQTGISYKKLFAEYLRGAERITVQDPYIRFAHQYRNFVEFCLMISNNKSPDELVQLELVTWNDEEYQAESIGYLEEIKDDVAILGIELTYRMEKHHDRYVAADNGWKITMGRGLDIFERNESRFDVSNLDQTKRKCKACEFTYIKI